MPLEVWLHDNNLTTPTLVDNLTERVEKLNFSTALNGGFRLCSFNLNMPASEAWMWLSREGKRGFHFNRLTVYDGLTLVWEGRIMEIQLNVQAGQESITVRVQGYWGACRDQLYTTSGNTDWSSGSGHEIDDIIKEMLTEECPDINTDQSNIAAGTRDLVGIDFAAKEYPQVRINQLTLLSDNDYGVWFFAIWDNRVPYLFKRSVTAIDWHIWLDSLQDLRLNQSALELRNSIIPFAGGTEKTAVTDATSQVLYPVREAKFSLPTGVANDPAADAGTKEVTERALPRQQIGFKISGKIYRSTSNTGGRLEEIPKWHVRAGEVLRIQDLVSGTSTVSLDDVRTFYIMETQYDADTDVLTIQPDRRSRRLTDLIPRAVTVER